MNLLAIRYWQARVALLCGSHADGRRAQGQAVQVWQSLK